MGREVPFRGSRSHIHLHKPQEQMQTGLTNLFVSLLKLALQKDPHSGGSLGCQLRVFKSGLYSDFYRSNE